MTTRYAITGVTGCLGRALVQVIPSPSTPLGVNCARDPLSIRALARTPNSFTESLRLRGHEIVPGDLDDPEALDRLVAGVDVVFHCAAQMGNADEAASERVNVDGTRLLAEACARAGVKRLVYVSSISVYSATTRREHIEEGDLPENVDQLCAYARTKLGGELAVRDVSRRTGLRFTIIRPTNVYGPWSGPWFVNWARLLDRVPVRFGNVPIDVVHADDVARAMIRAAGSADAINEVFHIGHEQMLMRDFLGRIGDAIGRRTYRLPDVIDWLVRVMAHYGFRARTGRTLGLPLLERRTFSHAKAAHLIGYQPTMSLGQGFNELRRWYRGEFLSAEQMRLA